MNLTTLIHVLTTELIKNGDVAVYIDGKYAVAGVGMDADGTLNIQRDTGAVDTRPASEKYGPASWTPEERGEYRNMYE